MRVACIGECMVELSERADGSLVRGFGGDTLNTALYLARLGVAVDYVTALGDDVWSDEMAAAWAREGIGLGQVRRLPGRMPGLYIIRTDPAGERSFHYWRERAAARDLFAGPGAAGTRAALAAYDLVYVSGISLSLYGGGGRAALAETLAALRARGGRVAFDTNYRPRGWPDRDEARAAFRAALAMADLIFASVEDLDWLFGAAGEAEVLRHRGRAEIVLKVSGGPGPVARVLHGADETAVPAGPAARVVDTTAAGDSFAAGYLAARIAGLAPEAAAAEAHRLAGAVIGHRGAVIPEGRDAGPALRPPASGRLKRPEAACRRTGAALETGKRNRYLCRRGMAPAAGSPRVERPRGHPWRRVPRRPRSPSPTPPRPAAPPRRRGSARGAGCARISSPASSWPGRSPSPPTSRGGSSR